MKNSIKHPNWIFKILAGLCFMQIKDQLTYLDTSHHKNPPSFVYNGELYAFINNRSIIVDEPFVECHIKSDFYSTVN